MASRRGNSPDSCRRSTRSTRPGSGAELIDAFALGPVPAALPAVHAVLGLFNLQRVACRTAPEPCRPLLARADRSSPDKDTRGVQPGPTQMLQDPFHTKEKPQRDVALQPGQAKGRDWDPTFHVEQRRLQPAGDSLGMEIVIEMGELDRRRIEGVPRLAPEQPAGDRLEVALVGELQ